MPRGEQRAMLLLSLLVILSLGVRIGFQMLPAREPPGMDQFREEALAIMAAQELSDSLAGLSKVDDSSTRPYRARSYSRQSAGPYYQKKPNPKLVSINLNEADSASLLPLPGIGPVFAGRIVKYRNLLGGFVDAEQLIEVYGMERTTVELVTRSLYMDSSLIRTLNLDSAGFRELLRHPYLEYEHVKALVNYRDIMGHISTLEELSQNMIIPDSVLDRVAPYLEISSGE